MARTSSYEAKHSTSEDSSCGGFWWLRHDRQCDIVKFFVDMWPNSQPWVWRMGGHFAPLTCLGWALRLSVGWWGCFFISFFCGFFLHCLTKFDVQNGLGQIKWTQWYSFLKPSQLPRNFVVIEMLRSLVERTGFAGSVKQMMFHLGPSRVGPPVNLALLIVFEEWIFQKHHDRCWSTLVWTPKRDA